MLNARLCWTPPGMYSRGLGGHGLRGLAPLLEVLVDVALERVTPQPADRLGDQGVQVRDHARDVGVLGDGETVRHGASCCSMASGNPRRDPVQPSRPPRSRVASLTWRCGTANRGGSIRGSRPCARGAGWILAVVVNRHVLLAVDLGTTSLKTCLYEVERAGCTLLAATHDRWTLVTASDGTAEQDPADWWAALVDCVPELLDATGTRPDEVGGLTFCAQMQCLVLVDESGEPVRPALSYLDQRPTARMALADAGRAQGRGHRRCRCCSRGCAWPAGWRASAKDPLWKYLRVADEEPEAFARVASLARREGLPDGPMHRALHDERRLGLRHVPGRHPQRSLRVEPVARGAPRCPAPGTCPRSSRCPPRSAALPAAPRPSSAWSPGPPSSPVAATPRSSGSVPGRRTSGRRTSTSGPAGGCPRSRTAGSSTPAR